MDWKYNDRRTAYILDTPAKSRKKVTATRLAGILELNQWTSSFQMWCEICKLPTPPFEDNKYTLAGKAIEPKLIQLARDEYFDLDSNNVQDPKQYWGNNYDTIMKKMDFFPTEKIFGGMWDAVYLNDNKEIDTIIECKTSSRPQDWVNGVPVYYKIQGLMYAYLTGAKHLIFPVAFLKDNDYNRPEDFVCDTTTNSKIYEVDVNEKIEWNGEKYDIKDLMAIVEDWYSIYVEKGFSPDFDEERDKEYLTQIRTKKPEIDSSLDQMIAQAKLIQAKLEELGVADLEKQLKQLEEGIKNELKVNLNDTTDKVEYNGYKLSKSVSSSIDKDLLQNDGLLDKYLKTSVTYRLTKIKED